MPQGRSFARRALRDLCRRDGTWQRFLRVERSYRAGTPFPRAGRIRRRGSAARSGYGLHSRAGAWHASRRGRRHRDRSPHHAVHRYSLHPRSHPVPIAAAGGHGTSRRCGCIQFHGTGFRRKEMRFAWLVARRYLRSPYKPAVLRLVTLFSVIGIGAGVATLVIALSMNTGFRRTIQDRLLSVSAHVNLTRPGAEGIEDYEALAEKLSHVAGVRSVAPAIYLTVLLSGGGHARGVVIKGIDPERERG